MPKVNRELEYDYSEESFGLLVTRKSDGATMFLQGDEADELLKTLEECFTRTGRTRRMPDGYPVLNYILSEYDECFE